MKAVWCAIDAGILALTTAEASAQTQPPSTSAPAKAETAQAPTPSSIGSSRTNSKAASLVPSRPRSTAHHHAPDLIPEKYRLDASPALTGRRRRSHRPPLCQYRSKSRSA